ncbi:MAG: hypothetical protein SGILL_008043, partial [Bacillariaceae sp.]
IKYKKEHPPPLPEEGVEEQTYQANLAAWKRDRDQYVNNEVAMFEERQEAKAAKRKADQAREAARLEQNLSSSEDELAKGATSGARPAKPSDNVDSSDYDSDEYDWMKGELQAQLKSKTISTEEWMKAKRRLRRKRKKRKTGRPKVDEDYEL